MHTHVHTPMGGCCCAGRCQPHWEQLRVQRLAQGHRSMRTLGAGIHWTIRQTFELYLTTRLTLCVVLSRPLVCLCVQGRGHGDRCKQMRKLVTHVERQSFFLPKTACFHLLPPSSSSHPSPPTDFALISKAGFEGRVMNSLRCTWAPGRGSVACRPLENCFLCPHIKCQSCR